MATSEDRGSSTSAPLSTSEEIKSRGHDLGADLVGIADADELDENPPDPNHPQTPSRIWDEVESVVVVGLRNPLGEFLSDSQRCRGNQSVVTLRKLEKIAHRLSHVIEREHGERALVLPGEETDPELKGGSYGPLSNRHVAAEAGLGTFGLEANLLTPEYGPRVYFELVLTTADLEADGRIEHQVCIGENCGRCLKACPSDAVEQFHLDKVSCASAAQIHGLRSLLYGPMRAISAANNIDEVMAILDTGEMFKKYEAVTRGINAYGACPRCIEVCPIGVDYRRFLSQEHKNIPEATKENEDELQEMMQAREKGEYIDWNKPVNERWIGEKGYKHFKQILSDREDNPDE